MRRALAAFGLTLSAAAVPAAAQQREAAVTDRVQQARELVTMLAAERFADVEAAMNETMQQAVPEARLRETWRGLVAQVGAMRGQRDAVRGTTGGMETVTISVDFERAPFDVKVTYDGGGRVAGLLIVPPAVPWTAPAYVDAAAFRSEEVVVGSGATALPGTLTLPVVAGRYPAVVLVHGSGPQDRDESAGGVKPFRDLAEGLASRGIAVLRYEKRTRVHPESFGGRFTVWEETVGDALFAAAMLRARPEVDPARVYVVGHSLGGMLAPRIAEADTALAGLVILAGNTRPIPELVLEQTAYLASLTPRSAMPASEADAQQKQLEAIRADAAKVQAIAATDNASTAPILRAPPSYWLDLRDYRPAEVARRLGRPILVLQGGRDFQVTMRDFDGWRTALAGDARATFRTFPELNHFLVSGSGPSTPAEYARPGHVAAEVIDAIAGWISAPSAPRP